jgi:hypothetical protein
MIWKGAGKGKGSLAFAADCSLSPPIFGNTIFGSALRTEDDQILRVHFSLLIFLPPQATQTLIKYISLIDYVNGNNF